MQLGPGAPKQLQSKEIRMDGWLGPLLILVGWVALQTWVLPRLGVPT